MLQGFVAGWLLVRFWRALAWLLLWVLVGFLPMALPQGGLGWALFLAFGWFAWRCRQRRLSRARVSAIRQVRERDQLMERQAELNAQAWFAHAEQLAQDRRWSNSAESRYS